MNKEHNGWTNYATWRVNVEIIDGIEIDTIICAEYIKEYVEDVVFSQYELLNGSHLIEDYARAFVSQVNFYEIAQRINEELELQT